ncbi:helix-turn-helix domain-containing protein [Ekhidna sp. To15]|uniref:helix-turn-helix domain-containing protein n=1 Tax=Ekhidna sp. To15 TaxID=3395267 RepID=UPI003F524961
MVILVNTIGIFGVLSGSAVAISLFLSIFFLSIKRKENSRHLWVGLILLAICLRVGKSIIYFLANDIAPVGLALGFLGLASIGPLIWLFVQADKSFKIRSAVHFILPVSGALGCYIVSPSRWETIMYKGGTIVLLLYLIASWVYATKFQKGSSWDRKVLFMTSGVWLALAYQHLSNTMMDYAFGSIIASVFLYWIFYQSFKSGGFAKGLTVKLSDNTLSKVKEAFENQKVFREQGLNLQQFSSQHGIPSYLVTRSVKQLYNRSFPEALNYFRIEEIKQMLLDSKKEHLKIESLAYDVGFTSPSAFYASFKKVTGQTPTEYQRAAALMSA